MIRNRTSDVDLKVLATLLGSPGFPNQAMVASAIGCDQPFISRARAGKLSRVTPRVERLWDYAQSRISTMQMADAARQAYEQNAPDRDRWKRPALNEQGFRESATVGLQQYLDDGFDPRLIVEQLAVLRRAQSRVARDLSEAHAG